MHDITACTGDRPVAPTAAMTESIGWYSLFRPHDWSLDMNEIARTARTPEVIGTVPARFSPANLPGDLVVAVLPTGALQVGCYEIDHRDAVLALVSRLLSAVHRMQSA